MRKPSKIELISDGLGNTIIVAYNRHDEILAEFPLRQHDHDPSQLKLMFEHIASSRSDISSEEFWQIWQNEANHNKI